MTDYKAEAERIERAIKTRIHVSDSGRANHEPEQDRADIAAALEAAVTKATERFLIETCDNGHQYAKLDGKKTRCPECLAIGLERARQRASSHSDGERRFPLQGGPSLPWRLIGPYETQAQKNHGQSLDRLAQRGGLSPGEAMCLFEGRALFPHPEHEEALAYVKRVLADDEFQRGRVAGLREAAGIAREHAVHELRAALEIESRAEEVERA